MGHYYYVSASLPPIALDEELEISFPELRFRYQMNFSQGDLKKVAAIQEMIDIGNILHFLKEEPIDPRGSLTRKELEEALLNKTHFSPYIFDVLDRYTSKSEQILHFQRILSLFFSHQIARSDGFLKLYFEFERNLRLVLLGYRAKRLKRDVVKELQYEDLSDPIVAYIIAQKEGATFEFPFEFEDLGERLKEAKTPLIEHQIIEEYRIEKIAQLHQEAQFDIDWLLAYMIKLIAVENWKQLNEEKGRWALKEYLRT